METQANNTGTVQEKKQDDFMDLSALLNGKTEKKAFTPDIEDVDPDDDDDDHDDQEGAEHEANAAAMAANVTDFKKMSETFVNAIDCVQATVSTISYNLICFTKDERTNLRALNAALNGQKKGGEKVTLNETDLKLLEEFKEFDEYAKEVVPFSEKEKELLAEPLARMLEQKLNQASSTTTFWTTLGLLMIPRSIPIAAKSIGKLFSK